MLQTFGPTRIFNDTTKLSALPVSSVNHHSCPVRRLRARLVREAKFVETDFFDLSIKVPTLVIGFSG